MALIAAIIAAKILISANFCWKLLLCSFAAVILGYITIIIQQIKFAAN